MATDHRVLMDSFADARRTWDDLVALQPDVKAASGHLDERDLVEFERRIEAHRMAIDMLADAVEAEPSAAPGRGTVSERRAGISNRESENQEAAERQEHPSIRETQSPGVGKVAGAFGKRR